MSMNCSCASSVRMYRIDLSLRQSKRKYAIADVTVTY